MSYPYRHFLISSLIIFPLHQFLLVSMSTTSCSSFGATYAPIKKRKNPNASTASSSSRPHPLTASKSPIHTTFYWRTSAPRFTASPSISGNIESYEVKSDALSYPGREYGNYLVTGHHVLVGSQGCIFITRSEGFDKS
jgi:hypothetical protein